jgi:hypothetical protein
MSLWEDLKRHSLSIEHPVCRRHCDVIGIA